MRISHGTLVVRLRRIRVADQFKIFTNINNTVIDPKKLLIRGRSVGIRGRRLHRAAELGPRWRRRSGSISVSPRDVLTVCLGKSTYARCGIIVNVTPFEPEWEGTVTLEISNTTRCLPRSNAALRGIAQVLFFPERRSRTRALVCRQGRKISQAAWRDASEDLARPVDFRVGTVGRHG